MKTYLISARPENKKDYLRNIYGTAEYCDVNGYSGTLLFTGNDTLIEPWSLAQSIIQRTQRTSPLIAVNPLYMHPYTVAKLVASIDMLYDRKIALNMVTGLSKLYLSSLGDSISKDGRYRRLGEFMQIVDHLLTKPQPLSMAGEFYEVSQLTLERHPKPENIPEYYVSGGSEFVPELASGLNTRALKVLPQDWEQQSDSLVDGVYFGIISGPDLVQSFKAAERLFPDSERNRFVFEHTMQNTDSLWKRRLQVDSEHAMDVDNRYWLRPFVNFQADCPYLVGDYRYIADAIHRLKVSGVKTLVIDTPYEEQALYHMHRALSDADLF